MTEFSLIEPRSAMINPLSRFHSPLKSMRSNQLKRWWISPSMLFWVGTVSLRLPYRQGRGF